MPKKKTKIKIAIAYHNDPDGHLSCHIARKHLHEKHPDASIRLYPMQYSDETPRELFLADSDIVWMVDFSLAEKPGEMERLAEKGGNFVWIDHHVSAIKKLAHLAHLPGWRNTERAACQLTYWYVNASLEKIAASDFSDLPRLPFHVEMVGDYDCWRWKSPGYPKAKAAQAEAFRYGLMARDTDPRLDFWSRLESSDVQPTPHRIMRDGETVKRFLRESAHRSIMNMSWETDIEIDNRVFSAICLNSAGSSLTWEPGGEINTYDVCVLYRHFGDKWVFQLRSANGTGVALTVAAHFGGGGHADAAGFSAKELPFKPKNL